MKVRLAAATLLMFFSFSCKTTGSHENTKVKAIIGENNLRDLNDPIALELHGLIKSGNRDCNATVIGPTHVAAAMHCIGDDPQAFNSMRFTIKGEDVKLVDLFFLDSTKDLAIYLTSKTFHQHYDVGVLDPAQPITVIAFDAGGKLKTDTCKVGNLLTDHAAFQHYCDTKKGFSGGSMLQNRQMVGMHIGFNPKTNVNYALNMSDYANTQHDITALEVDAELEWPHVRSPHVRSPHIRNEISDFDISKPVWKNNAGKSDYCCTDNDGRCYEYSGNNVLVDAQYKAALACKNRFSNGQVSGGKCKGTTCFRGGAVTCSTPSTTGVPCL